MKWLQIALLRWLLAERIRVLRRARLMMITVSAFEVEPLIDARLHELLDLTEQELE
jgi:hypothetical protein